MREEQDFRDWLLISQGIATPDAYVRQIERIERIYGDIDACYAKDGCASLLEKFKYTKNDERNKREPEHGVEINPQSGNDKYKAYYKGTNDLASRIRKYIAFRVRAQDGQLGQVRYFPQPNASDGSASVTQQSKQNIRYKGNPIGNAQNLVIRTVLSNLGDESFSEKDWDDTKTHFGNRCVYCGASNKKIVRDHAIPINKYKLGEHRLGNIVPACESCNNKKGDQDYIEFCGGDKDAISKIEKYMESKKYRPLTADASKSDGIRIVLHKAHEEIRVVAMKYIELINDLFFSQQ